MTQTSSTEYDTTDKRNPTEGAVANSWYGATSAVVYGPFSLSCVTQIKESFANQSIREFDRFTQYGKWLGFHGGNIAITVHGFLRGRNRRAQKNIFEAIRNLQAGVAHIPGSWGFGQKDDQRIGIGNTILWLLSWFFPFSSEMCFQTNMVIKTMEFEHSGHYADEYPYVIVFEKLSFGVIQYFIDFIVNLVSGFATISQGRFASMQDAVNSGGANATTMLQSMASNMNQQISLGDSDVDPNILANLNASISKTSQLAGGGIGSSGGGSSANGDLGNLIVKVTDNEVEVPNIPNRWSFSSFIDETLRWKDVPFLDTFPQRFSFALKSDEVQVSVSAENQDSISVFGSGLSIPSINQSEIKPQYVYTMAMSIVDTIFEDTDSPKYALRISIYKGNELVFTGTILPGTQYIFDGVLAIYIKNFDMSINRDGILTHTISGMVARVD